MRWGSHRGIRKARMMATQAIAAPALARQARASIHVRETRIPPITRLRKAARVKAFCAPIHGMKKKPPRKDPRIDPKVLMAYRVPMLPPRCWTCRVQILTTQGKVAPINRVGMIMTKKKKKTKKKWNDLDPSKGKFDQPRHSQKEIRQPIEEGDGQQRREPDEDLEPAERAGAQLLLVAKETGEGIATAAQANQKGGQHGGKGVDRAAQHQGQGPRPGDLIDHGRTTRNAEHQGDQHGRPKMQPAHEDPLVIPGFRETSNLLSHALCLKGRQTSRKR